MNKPAEAKLKSTDAKQRDWFTMVTQIHSNYCEVFFWDITSGKQPPDSMDTLRNRCCTLLKKGQTMKRHKNKKKSLYLYGWKSYYGFQTFQWAWIWPLFGLAVFLKREPFPLSPLLSKPILSWVRLWQSYSWPKTPTATCITFLTLIYQHHVSLIKQLPQYHMINIVMS